MRAQFSVVALVFVPQTATSWSDEAHRRELAGDRDGATIAWARSLLDDDVLPARRELARLTEDRAALRLTLRLPPDPDVRWTPSLSSAAGRLATGWSDVRVWDVVSGALVAEPIPVPAREVHLDPTGERVVLVDAEQAASLWRVAPPEKVLDLGPGWAPTAWSPDGKRVARSVGLEEEVHVIVWDAADGEVLFRWRAPDEASVDLALSVDGLLAIDCGEVAVFDVGTGAQLATGLPSGGVPLRFHPRARRLMVHDGARGTLRAFDLETSAWSGPELACPQFAFHIATDASGERWVVATRDQAVSSLSDGTPAGLPLQADDLEDERAYGIALAPDGSLQAVPGLEDTVRIWDSRSGRRLIPTPRHGARVTALCFTSARSLVTSSDDGIVRVWEPSALTSADTVDDRAVHAIYDLEGSPRVLVLRHQPLLELVEANGTTRWQCEVQVNLVGLSVSRDGARVAGIGGAYGVWTFDCGEGAPEPRRISPMPWTAGVALDADGKRVAAADMDVARVWDLSSGALVSQHSLPNRRDALLAFDARGRVWGDGFTGLAPLGADPPMEPVGGEDSLDVVLALDAFGEAYMVEIESDEAATVTWHGRDQEITGLEQLVDQSGLGKVRSWLCSGTRAVSLHDEGACLVDPVAPRLIAKLDDLGALWTGKLVADRLALRGLNAVALFDAHDGRLLAKHAPLSGFGTISPIPGTDRLLQSRVREELHVIDVISNTRVGQLIPLEGEPSCVVTADPDEAFVATAEGAILRVDLTSAEVQEVVPGKGVPILHMQRSPDGSRLVYVEHPDVVVLWDLAVGRALHQRKLAPNLQGKTPLLAGTWPHDDPVAIQFDPTGKWLLVASHLLYSVGGGGYNHAPAEAQIIDAHTGDVVSVLEGSDGMVQIARFSADGERLVAWKWKDLHTWETRTGRALAHVQLDEHIDDVCFHAEARFVAALAEDATFGVWDADTGAAHIGPRQVTENRYATTRLDPDGRWLYVSGGSAGDQWIDLATGVASVARHAAPLAHGPDELLLLGGGLLARWTPRGIEPLGVRHWLPFAAGGGGNYRTFLDARRIVVGPRDTEGGLEFQIVDYGPARNEPVQGLAADLLANWCTRLGLEVITNGRIEPRTGR
jgi:WD40 repeat protein